MAYDPQLIRKCVAMHKQGITAREIWEREIRPINQMVKLNTFKRTLRDWQQKAKRDEKLLESANLNYQFSPYASTVRVDGQGKIVEAWVKQSSDDYALLLDEIKANTPHKEVQFKEWSDSCGMLELPLFDMHFGIADIDHYLLVLSEILGLINLHKWKKIICIIGQDLLHNDDMRGRTAKGTQIDKIDVPKAWNDAKTFWYNIIDSAIDQAENVKIYYSKGNHDESLSWAFCQMLKERYGESMVEDTTDQWKAISWENVFIGISHGDKGSKRPAELVALFASKFPYEWAKAKTREIHLGHLHTEMDGDPPGARVRRLGSKNKTDKWSDDNGFVGGQNRFSVFEWEKDKLRAIYYF